MKRILSMILAVILAAGMLAGCGGSPTPAPTEASVAASASTAASTEASASAEAPSATPEPVVLTLWLNANQQTPENLEMEKRFQEKYPYITLNKVLVTEGAGTDYATAFAAGTNPDVGGTGAPQMAAYAYADMCAPLDDYFAGWDAYPNINKATVDNFAIAGKHYGLPAANYTMVLCYNKKIFADAGMQPPKTWQEWIDTSIKLTDPAKQQWGMNMLVSYWTEWWFEYFVWMAGGDLTKQNPDGTLQMTFDDPAIAKAVDFYRQMIAAKCIQPDLTMDYENLQKQFSLGHAAMTLNGSSALSLYVNQGMKAEDVGYAELPAGPSGSPVSQLGGDVNFIFSNVDKAKQDAAWAWISFRNSKEELETDLRIRAEKGGADPFVPLRTDLDMSLGKINPELQAVVDKCAASSKLEFYGKGVIGGYVDKAVQKSIFDPKADVLKVFMEQQDQAAGDAKAFNDRVLESKK